MRAAPRRTLATLIATALSAAPACAFDLIEDWPERSAFFVQLGASDDAKAFTAGATYDLRWSRGHLHSFVETSFGRWNGEKAPGEDGGAWIVQVGLTPVLRWHPGGSPRWYLEGGVGANLLLPVWRSRDKRFSTVFNFGDHLAVGRRFGDDGKHELALRIQHFSNAGIRRPNPGENFVQLRYTRRL